MEKGCESGTSPAAYPTSFVTSHTSTAFTFDMRCILLFSASQRHLAWDIRLGIGMLRPMEQASLPKHVRCEYNQ